MRCKNCSSTLLDSEIQNKKCLACGYEDDSLVDAVIDTAINIGIGLAINSLFDNSSDGGGTSTDSGNSFDGFGGGSFGGGGADGGW